MDSNESEELIQLIKMMNGNSSQTSIITLIMSIIMLLLFLSKVYQIRNMSSCNNNIQSDIKELSKTISILNETIDKKKTELTIKD